MEIPNYNMEEYSPRIQAFIVSPLGTPFPPEHYNMMWPHNEKVMVAQWCYHIAHCDECQKFQLHDADKLCPVAEDHVPLVRSRT